MPSMQAATHYYGLVNILVRLLGFFGPALTDHRDRWINIQPGLLLGILAVNWLHALLRVVVGLLSLPALRTAVAAVAYVGANAALLGLLSMAGGLKGRGRRGIHFVMKMALHMPDN